MPTISPLSNLVYAAEGSDVDTTIIDGKMIMESRIVKTLDESKILKQASERGEKLLERSGIKVDSKWPHS